MIRLVLSRAEAERIVRALHELVARTLDVEEELHARVLAKFLGSALRTEPEEPRR